MLNIKIALLNVLLQTSFKSELTNFLTNYLTPIVAGLLLISSSKGLINAVDMIMDREDRGTTKDGWIKLAKIVFAIGLVVIVLQLAVTKLGGLNMSM